MFRPAVPCFGSDAAIAIARRRGGHLGDRPHAHRMVVAPGQQCRPGRRAYRGAVKPIELQPFSREPLSGGVLQGPPKAEAAPKPTSSSMTIKMLGATLGWAQHSDRRIGRGWNLGVVGRQTNMLRIWRYRSRCAPREPTAAPCSARPAGWTPRRRSPSTRPARRPSRTDHVRIEVEQHLPIPFQPRFIPDKGSGRGRPPAADMIALPLVGRKPAHRHALLERHRPRVDQRQAPRAGLSIDVGDLELPARRRRRRPPRTTLRLGTGKQSSGRTGPASSKPATYVRTPQPPPQTNPELRNLHPNRTTSVSSS